MSGTDRSRCLGFHRFGVLALVCALFHIDLPACAQDPEPAAADEFTEEIIVTAHRREVPADAVGSSVSVIDGAALELLGPATVGDAVRAVPGLEILSSGGPGQVTSVFLRGGSSSQTLVLIDGIRANSATTGAFDFADLRLTNVERIEVVRGPQSTLYGSEAMGGVIQILTKRGSANDPRRFVLGLEAGEEKTHHLSLGAFGQAGSLDWALQAADFATDGVSAADVRRGNLERDGHDNLSASTRLGFTPNDRTRFDLTVRAWDGETEIDGFAFPAGPVDALNASNLRQAFHVSLSFDRQISARWHQSLQIGFVDDELEGRDLDNFFGNFVIDSRDLEFLSRTDLDLEGHRWSAGLSFEERRGGSVGSFDEQVEVAAVFVQDLIALGETAHLTLGLRHDDHSEFGGETTYRAALAWSLPANLRLHASFGTGFKAPTLNDLYFPFFSNPDLLPETSSAVDLGLSGTWLGGRVRGDLTAFSSDYDDLIAFDFATFLPQNIARARSRGVEAQLRWQSADEAFAVNVSHTFNEAEDRDSGLQLARRPKQRSVIELVVRPTRDWQIVATYVAASERRDSNGSSLEDYDQLDLGFRYKGFENIEPSFRLLNAFDDDASLIAGFGRQERQLLAGVTWHF